MTFFHVIKAKTAIAMANGRKNEVHYLPQVAGVTKFKSSTLKSWNLLRFFTLYLTRQKEPSLAIGLVLLTTSSEQMTIGHPHS